MRNPETIRPVTLSSRISLWKTKEEEQAARQLTAEAQINAWRAILPGLLQKIARLNNPRWPGSTRHKFILLMVFGLFLFVFQYNSRREANRELSSPHCFRLVTGGLSRNRHYFSSGHPSPAFRKASGRANRKYFRDHRP